MNDFFIVATPGNTDDLVTFLVQQCMIIDPSHYFHYQPEVNAVGGYRIPQAMFIAIQRKIPNGPRKKRLFVTYSRNSANETFQLYTSTAKAA